MKFAFFCIFWKFKKRISFKFRFRKLNFGKLVKVNFIFRFFCQFFHVLIYQCNIQKEPPEVFYNKKCYEKFHKIHRKHLYQCLFFLFFNKVYKNCIKKETLIQVLSCEFCEIYPNTFLRNTSGRLLRNIVYKIDCTF